MTTSVEKLLANVGNYKYDPASIQRAQLNILREVSGNSIDIVDPTNPVVYSLECSAILTAGAIVENSALNRKQYPSTSQFIDDLYPHMSDKDMIDVFAVPSTAKILFLFNKDEILSKLVTDPNNTGIKKIVIPRNTSITIAENYVFSINYPIEIKQMAHGGLQIVYDVSSTSPVQSLSTNVINKSIIKDDVGTDYIAFEVEAYQLLVTSQTISTNLSTAVVKKLSFTDQYYYCRAWNKNNDGTYTELNTTYSQDVYDIKTPTVVLTVLDGTLQVKIPQIYITNGMISSNVRIDIYQTKGPLTLDLSSYSPEQFVANFNSFDENDINEFVAPIKTLKSLYIHSTNYVNSGKNGLTFDELRSRVISNGFSDKNLPITNVQVESTLLSDGYSIVKNIDNITNRQFLASRGMPDPTVKDILTAAAGGMVTLSTTMNDAVLIDSIVDNGDIVTIKPDTLFKITNGIASIVSNSEYQLLKSLTNDQLATAVSGGTYFYTPFYYVMDSSNSQFNLRAYHLNTPIVNTKSFIGENDTTLLQVSVDTYLLSKTDTGYTLRIQTTSSSTFMDLSDDSIFVQLAFTPPGETNRAYILGELISKTDAGERIYEFNINTNYSIDENNYISITNFQMYDQSDRVIDCELDTVFDILFSTNTAMTSNWRQSSIDMILGSFQLPNNTVAITHEQMDIRLGYRLDNLWSRTRTIIGDEQYQVWETDVPALYTKDVYDIFPETGTIFKVENGQLIYNKLHSIGDPVLDVNNNPVYKYRAGDIKTDSNGNPLVKSQRTLKRQMDIFMIDGVYYFATNQISINYRQLIVDTIVSWIVNDLSNIDSILLDQSNIYFYPLTTIGNVDVMYSNGQTKSIKAAQSFEIDLYVKSNVYNDSQLKDAIKTKTISTLSDQLNQQVVSTSDQNDALRTQYKNDVVAINLSKLGDNSDLDVVTLIKESQRLSLAKKLVSRSDGTLSVEENVTINFIKHEIKT